MKKLQKIDLDLFESYQSTEQGALTGGKDNALSLCKTHETTYGYDNNGEPDIDQETHWHTDDGTLFTVGQGWW